MSFIDEIYTCAPGSGVLVVCPQRLREEMIKEISISIPDSIRKRTALNSTEFITTSVAPGDSAANFSDLAYLNQKLVDIAGKKSHFEGILMVDISEFCGETDRGVVSKLKALGELLAIREGPASQCITVMYGPENEEDIFRCADALDFNGVLKVITFEHVKEMQYRKLLSDAGKRFASNQTREHFTAVLLELSDYQDFDPNKFARICMSGSGLITDEMIDRVMNDPNPYTYVNRVRNERTKKQDDHRKIGFAQSNEMTMKEA